MARASGKVILLGEHAVVYGVPAIAAGIERGATATATQSEVATLRIGERVVRMDENADLARAFASLSDSLGARPCRVDVDLELPAGAGLGASAALGVAIARALVAAEGAAPASDDARVLDAALAWERVFHGNPSGVDTAAAAHGGCIRFVRGTPPVPIPVAAPLRLGIAVAGPPASTKQMVEAVARLKARRPEVTDKALEGIRALVENAQKCIGAGDVIGLGKLLDLNQMLLAGLFVSTEEIEKACAVARDAGALGAKLTGAGGGGCVVALLPSAGDGVIDAWRKAGFEAFETTVAASRGTSTEEHRAS